MKLRVIVESGEEIIFSYVSPEKRPGELNTMCAINNKKEVIVQLAECIQVLCDSQFPLE